MYNVNYSGISDFRKLCVPTEEDLNSNEERPSDLSMIHTAVVFILELTLVWSHRPFAALEL